MITELILVEGVSDVQLISYYLQNVYEWKYTKENEIGIKVLDDKEHIETLTKNDYQLILCGVGGNSKFAHFVERHRINSIIIEKDISSLMVITDRDEDSILQIKKTVKEALDNLTINVGQWDKATLTDSFGLQKKIDTYLMIIPENEKGALERVVINALQDIPEEKDLIDEVVSFVDSLKVHLVPNLKQMNKANKATVGTFFSVRYPKQALRSFGTFISKIKWEESDSLRELFSPFSYLGKEKPTKNLI